MNQFSKAVSLLLTSALLLSSFVFSLGAAPAGGIMAAPQEQPAQQPELPQARSAPPAPAAQPQPDNPNAERMPAEKELAEKEAALAAEACSAEPMAVWPGPDGFGYAGAACAYNWVDITGTGTSVALGDDAYAGPFAIGFSFPFYGSAFSDLYVSSNGWISFDAPTSSYLTNQCPLPNSSLPNNTIALHWDDLDPGDTGDLVYYQSFASCPVGSGQCLVVLYDDFCHYPGGATCASAGTFEAILYDDGAVRVQFLDAGAELGSGSTTGIEGGNAVADHGLTYACDTAASLADNLCVQFQAVAAPILDVSKQAPGAVLMGEPITYTIHAQNVGSSDAASAWLEDPIPAGGTYIPGSVRCSSGVCSYDGGEDRVSWSGAISATEMITVEFAIDTAGAVCGDAISNTVVISDPAALGYATDEAWTEVWAFHPLPDRSGGQQRRLCCCPGRVGVGCTHLSRGHCCP